MPRNLPLLSYLTLIILWGICILIKKKKKKTVTWDLKDVTSPGSYNQAEVDPGFTP